MVERIKKVRLNKNGKEKTHIWDKGGVSMLSMEMFPTLREHYPFIPRQSVSVKGKV